VIPRLFAAFQSLFAPLLEYWSGLSRRRKLNLIANTLLILGAVWALRWYLLERAYRPLYTNLSDAEAGAAVERLRQLQVPYRLASNGGTVLVPESRLADVRLQLATEGLPQSGRLGFELFDGANFGATEFAEQVNFRRALEGELERSVLSLAEVERTRVHISLPKRSVFLDYDEPAKASVVMQLRPGAELTKQQTDGITHLVASAVEGLDPQRVVLVDTRGRMLTRSRARETGASDEQLEFQRRLEEQIEHKIEATLEPYVGFDKVRANAAAEVNWNGGEQTAEVLDPNTVAMTTQKLEEVSGPATQAGAPGTASNLPRQPLTPLASGLTNSRLTETTNYQTSRTVTRTEIGKGAVTRLSVAVLIDSKVRADQSGNPLREQRSAEEMQSLRGLAMAAAGISEQRGDRLTIESLPFTIFDPLPAPGAGSDDRSGWERILRDLYERHRYYVLAGAAAAVLLLTALTWLAQRRRAARRLLRRQQAGAETEHRALTEAESEAQRQQAEQARLLTGLKTESLQSTKAQVLKKHLEEVARKDTPGFVQLLRSWIHEDEK
jgi:flagellar M-ring protein FliF